MCRCYHLSFHCTLVTCQVQHLQTNKTLIYKQLVQYIILSGHMFNSKKDLSNNYVRQAIFKLAIK